MATFSALPLERTYSTADVVEQRARVRAKAAPKRGEHGLDIGCGPGLLACELARDAGPSGRMVGIDQRSDMVAMSGERARHISEGVAQAWADDVRGQDLHGRYFFSLSRFLFLAERPVTGG